MATLTLAEFTEAVTALAEQHGIERLRDRLAQMHAFTSRRGLNSAAAIAERLHMLTGGLRRQVAATYAFSSLWSEMVGGQAGEQRLEEQAETVNACLGANESIVEGREQELDQALAAYREILAATVGRRTAELDMLLKAVPAVADRLRAGVSVAPAGETTES
jgi:hypothetical protein